jgi:hypothetical protein
MGGLRRRAAFRIAFSYDRPHDVYRSLLAPFCADESCFLERSFVTRFPSGPAPLATRVFVLLSKLRAVARGEADRLRRAARSRRRPPEPLSATARPDVSLRTQTPPHVRGHFPPGRGQNQLTEKLLLFSGAIQIAGTVKDRKSNRYATSDWMEIEKQRGICTRP